MHISSWSLCRSDSDETHRILSLGDMKHNTYGCHPPMTLLHYGEASHSLRELEHDWSDLTQVSLSLLQRRGIESESQQVVSELNNAN